VSIERVLSKVGRGISRPSDTTKQFGGQANAALWRYGAQMKSNRKLFQPDVIYLTPVQ
jgi:hypothetical protein